jgi:antitoxin component YwqK of YwqJK toxin-antitoxin module
VAERYSRGRLVESTWYRPDGSIVAQTKWKNGSGLGYYLREDGSVSARMQYVDGVAHGQAVNYREDGSVERFAEFRDGVEVTPLPPGAAESPKH